MRNHRTVIVFLLGLFLAGFSVEAQELSTGSRRAVRYYEDGNRRFNLHDFAGAAESLEKAVDIDAGFLEAYMLLGDVYKSTGKKEKAVDMYRQVIRVDSVKYPEVYFFSGLLYFDLQQYQQAIDAFEQFLSMPADHQERLSEAGYFLACSYFAKEAMANPVPFSPENLGEGINTINDEYINSVRSDELVLYFTGRETQDRKTAGADDFYVSERTQTDAPWPEARKMGPPVNTPGDEGALTITPDGRYLLFAGCHWPDGKGSCDIYASQIGGKKILQPVNLGSPINSSGWESQPTLSSDGRTLYFASTRNGGHGNSDLWMSTLKDDGSWSIPENLGKVINTKGSEMAPFIHPDGQTLYFSSDHHIGMGGIDLYVSRKDSTGNWSAPVNLGFPVNTPGDEINIIVNARGDKAYMSVDRPGGVGGYDIFTFELHEDVRPVPSIYIKGVVSDAETGLPLEAYFSLSVPETGEEVVRSFSDPVDGNFLVCIPTNREYALNVSRQGYLFYSQNILPEGTNTELEPFVVDIRLKPIKEGESMVLRNIFFETDQFAL
ncbi:MAG: tetratricopeptide repeat protein, partial [Bacteroidota bacterium]